MVKWHYRPVNRKKKLVWKLKGKDKNVNTGRHNTQERRQVARVDLYRIITYISSPALVCNIGEGINISMLMLYVFCL